MIISTFFKKSNPNPIYRIRIRIRIHIRSRITHVNLVSNGLSNLWLRSLWLSLR